MYRHSIRLKHPASSQEQLWREALPLGNGLTGILVHGAIAEETVQFNRHDLWHGGDPGGTIPDISDSFREIRRRIERGEYLSANRNLMMEALRKAGYHAAPQTPFPLGNFHISYVPDTLFKGYERGLDMRSAEGYVRFCIGENHFCRRMFVSRDMDIAAFSMTADRAFSARYSFALYKENDTDGICTVTENQIVCRSGDGSYGVVIRFCGDFIAKILEDSLEITGKSYHILIKAFSHHSSDDLSDALALSYEALLENHIKRHTPLYDAVSIKLASEEAHNRSNEDLLAEAYDDTASPALIEKLWRFGRYLFISASSMEGNPVPLYGLWHGGDHMPWSQYVANENVQMTYWHTLAGGLADLVKPLLRYYTAKTEVFRECAAKLFGMKGIWLSAYTTPDVSGPCVPVGVIINWIGCGGWLCQHFWHYYRYTQDTETLKNEILPFMREVAQFWMDYIVYDASHSMKLYPSVSPENTPGNFIPEHFRENMGHICPTVQNASMDFAILKELLTNLLEGMAETGLYAEEAEQYRMVLKSIPPYAVNDDGAVKEWMAEDLTDHYYHRHLSHLYPVFPGNEIDAQRSPALFEAFRKAVELRQLGGQSGWSLAHMANIYARFGEGGRVLECIDLMTKSVLNNVFLTTHNDWRHMGMTLDLGTEAPIQLDAIFGTVNAVQEFIFRHNDGMLMILPAWCDRLSSGEATGVVFPHGVADIRWEEHHVSVRITAKCPFEADVVVGDTAMGCIHLEKGEQFTGDYWIERVR